MLSRPTRTRSSLVVAVVGLGALSACSITRTDGNDSARSSGSTAVSPQEAKKSQAAIASNIRAGAPSVGLDRKVRLTVRSGTFEQVKVAGPGGQQLLGKMTGGGTGWVSTTALKPASRYTVTSTAVDADGLRKTFDSSFKTRTLTLDEQTFPSLVPLPSTTVGVGMPVIIRFDVPVTDRASIQKHLQVVSSPAQPGAWHWMSDNEVHWRPKSYWKPGTNVTVKADIGGVPAGNGIYGQKDRTSTFHVGDAVISKVDTNTHQMKVYRNGTLLRTIPITTGQQPEFTTRSGTKVIVEKLRHTRMNSETIGIDPNSSQGYDLNDVEYAMRLTYSGEFIHAAPWSVGQQGVANVSHGCTGMSTANAEWLYNMSTIGDVVEYTGTNRPMTLTNGYGDWNLPFAAYRNGGASS